MKTLIRLVAATVLVALAAIPAMAAEPGAWSFKVGAGMVEPKSRNLVYNDGEDTLRVDVDGAAAVTLTATYMFSENWGLDILASTPFEHDIDMSVTGVGAGIDGVPIRIGSTKHLPPTFSIQYHFMPDADFQPYAGVGVNWTTFFDTKLIPALAEEGIADLELDDSIGLAAQIGADWNLTDTMFVNFDVRWINIESDATMIGTGPGEAVAVGTVKIDPVVYDINLGFRF